MVAAEVAVAAAVAVAVEVVISRAALATGWRNTCCRRGHTTTARTQRVSCVTVTTTVAAATAVGILYVYVYM